MDASKGDAAAPHSRSSNAREHAGSGSGPPAQHVSSTGAGLGAGVGAGAGAASATVQSHRDRMASPVGFPRRSDAPGAAAAAQHSGRSATVPATAGPATEHEWVSTIVPGQDLDVLDTFGKWCHAIAADVDDSSVFVHYVYWSSKWDERIPKSSHRLAPYRSHIYHEAGELKVGQRVDVFDRHESRRKWCDGEVVEAKPSEVKVHFYGWTDRWDEWHRRSSKYIAPFGQHTRTPRRYRPKAAKFWRNRERNRLVAASHRDQWGRYVAALEGMGLTIKECEGDGNCMFRAISHQVYGDDKFHAQVRAAAIEYMRVHRDWFQPFVAYSMASFDAYLTQKARDGVWGDDPELQALCELYDRPAHLYVYHPTKGATRLRTFHERTSGTDARPTRPMRLSYYGGGHYDSLVMRGEPTRTLTSKPGEFEAARLRSMRTDDASRHAAAHSDGKSEEASSASPAASAIQLSRMQFDANDSSVEDAMVRQLASQTDVEATRDAMVLAAQRLSAQEARAAQEQRDLKALEDTLVEEAKKASAVQPGGAAVDNVGGAEGSAAADPELHAALEASEEEAFAQQRAAIEAMAKAEEDEALRAAIVASAVNRTHGDVFDGAGLVDATGSGDTAEDDIMAAVLEASRREAMGGARPDDGFGVMGSRAAAGSGVALDNDVQMALAAGLHDDNDDDEQMDPDLQRVLAESLLGSAAPQRHE